jgi:hypothetical protein
MVCIESEKDKTKNFSPPFSVDVAAVTNTI